MKYTIELTDNQKKQMDLLCEIAHKHIGFNPKLEPIENLWESELEKHRKQAYNSAINDYNAMYEWLHDCFVDFEKFLLEKGFYTDEKFSDGFVVGQLMYDLICDHDITEVIREFKKWQEKKKKAEEVENYHILVDTLRTVTEEYSKETIVSALSEFGFEVDKLRGEEE